MVGGKRVVVQFSAGLLQNLHTASKVTVASRLTDTGGSFPGAKAAGA